MLKPLNHFFFMLFLMDIFFTNLVKHIGSPLAFLGLHNYELRRLMFMNFIKYKSHQTILIQRGKKIEMWTQVVWDIDQ